MKKTAAILFYLLSVAFLFVSCHPMTDTLEDFVGKKYERTNGEEYVLAYDGPQRKIPSGKKNTQYAGEPFNAFYINKYETTYDYWYKVRVWALDHGYVFDNTGNEGANSDLTGEPTMGKYKPVGGVSWWDCIIWCNALSEMKGKKPVYYSDAEYKNVLRGRLAKDSTTVNEVYIYSDTAGNKYMINCKSEGYRLPTSAEYTWAAHGGDPDAPDWNYEFSGSPDINEVAVWNTNATQPVGSKKPNRLGLYDMSGNLCEWVNNHTSTSLACGLNDGSYGVNDTKIISLRSDTWKNYNPKAALPWFSFRIAASKL